MSKLVSYQGCLMEPQTKIAIEALVLKAQKQQIDMILRYAWPKTIDICGKPPFEKTKQYRFLKQEAGKYGFQEDARHPWRWQFVGIKKTG